MKLLRHNPALGSILASVFIAETGAFAILPILPLYLRERGVPYSTAGLVVGAALVGQFLLQYPAGRLSDAIGRRPVMVASLVIASLTSAALVVPMPATALIGIRLLQGLAIGAFLPSANAAVADTVPETQRGAAYGLVTAATMAGLTMGPGLGGLLAGFGRPLVFEAIAAVLLAGSFAVFALVPAPGTRTLADHGAGRPRLPRNVLAAVCLVWVGGGFLFGSYDLVWPLFMHGIGANDLMVGLSFSLFGLPLVVLAPFTGKAADRFDARWLAVAGTAIAGLLAPVYPLLHNFWLVCVVGCFEAAGVALADPASQAYLMAATPEDQRGRAQGVLGSTLFGAQALGASIAGPLFAQGVSVPFDVGCVVSLLSVAGSIPLFRLAARRHSDAVEGGAAPIS